MLKQELILNKITPTSCSESVFITHFFTFTFMSWILTVNTIKSNVTNVWCAMKHNGKVLHFLHCRYNEPSNYARQLTCEANLCYGTQMMAIIFITHKTSFHIPVLMNQTASLTSFVLESCHCFHDIICESPKGFNIPFS
jgi:hypothetical protein